MNCSATLSTTYRRLTRMQTCPPWENAPLATPLAAAGTFTSEQTMPGSLPESSRTIGLIPAFLVMSRPVLRPPVNTRASKGAATMALPMSAPPISTWNRSSGMLVRPNASLILSPVMVVSSEGLNTTAFPAMRAGMSVIIVCQKG